MLHFFLNCTFKYKLINNHFVISYRIANGEYISRKKKNQKNLVFLEYCIFDLGL